MPKDNEKIIEICARISIQNRENMIDLITAGAPMELVHSSMQLTEACERVPMMLEEMSRRYVSESDLRFQESDLYAHHSRETAKAIFQHVKDLVEKQNG
jgi:hypothetical protein